jgi:hypothetical protein
VLFLSPLLLIVGVVEEEALLVFNCSLDDRRFGEEKCLLGRKKS